MPSPVSSRDFSAVDFGQRVCDVLTGLLSVGQKMGAFLNWLLGPDGELSDTALSGKMARYMPPGVILPYAGAFVPDGFLWCNGQAVSRTDYAALFAAIGTRYGAGDGSNTFNVPDLRRLFLRGAFELFEIGQTDGADTVSLTAANNGPHTHTFALEADGSPNQGQNWAAWEAGRASPELPAGGITSSSGSGAPFSVVPRHINILAIIKT